ncbi:glycosyltransferase [Bacillus alkalicellulosilyticus]|uniref:glycosyltransferase n=1 Tax=Alkalihalobacterium alkalicellulosilyticum TaxID=1912214 RepID=UPI0009969481|nr:glycosyltransferase [Bacillus alkalicellulosilyticus]
MTTVSVIFLLFILWTVLNSMFMPKLTQARSLETVPLVSILIPVRNEERNIKPLLQSLEKLTYKNYEVIFLDDQSTDQTVPLLQQGLEKVAGTVIHGRPLPRGWVGKVHACQQLSETASGDYYLFLDADVRIAPHTIEASLCLLTKRKAGLLTGFPNFPTTSFLSQLLVPMQHFIVLFHLPLFMANLTKLPAFTAAHGSFMFFRKEAYMASGGHKQVFNSLVEDVHLSREVKKAGYHVVLANITNDVTCHMYETNAEVWNGFLKNVFSGIGRSYVMGIGLICFYSIFLLPLFLIVTGSFVPLILLLVLRLYVDWRMNQRNLIFLLMPLSSLMIIVLLSYSMIQSLRKRNVIWKGRHYS